VSASTRIALRVSPEWFVGKTLWELDERDAGTARTLSDNNAGSPLASASILRSAT
jgi:hypothetical protein